MIAGDKGCEEWQQLMHKTVKSATLFKMKSSEAEKIIQKFKSHDKRIKSALKCKSLVTKVLSDEYQIKAHDMGNGEYDSYLILKLEQILKECEKIEK